MAVVSSCCEMLELPVITLKKVEMTSNLIIIALIHKGYIRAIMVYLYREIGESAKGQAELEK